MSVTHADTGGRPEGAAGRGGWHNGGVTADLLARARGGDADAFGELVGPHRRELEVHCYRILGSASDAEDVLQEALLAAWQGLGGFEGRASVRTWLYRIATTRSLNALRSARRRPRTDWPPPGVDTPEPTRLGETPWLEPYPDVLLEGLADAAPGPEVRYEASEAISLAFIIALQTLPPRQRAVLILREVLDFPAREVADMLGTTEESVKSALKRARAALRRQFEPSDGREPPPPLGRRYRWSTWAVSSSPGSFARPSSGRASAAGRFRPGPTASPRLSCTSSTSSPAPPVPPACWSLPSPAAGSAR